MRQKVDSSRVRCGDLTAVLSVGCPMITDSSEGLKQGTLCTSTEVGKKVKLQLTSGRGDVCNGPVGANSTRPISEANDGRFLVLLILAGAPILVWTEGEGRFDSQPGGDLSRPPTRQAGRQAAQRQSSTLASSTNDINACIVCKATAAHSAQGAATARGIGSAVG